MLRNTEEVKEVKEEVVVLNPVVNNPLPQLDPSFKAKLNRVLKDKTAKFEASDKNAKTKRLFNSQLESQKRIETMLAQEQRMRNDLELERKELAKLFRSTAKELAAKEEQRAELSKLWFEECRVSDDQEELVDAYLGYLKEDSKIINELQNSLYNRTGELVLSRNHVEVLRDVVQRETDRRNALQNDVDQLRATLKELNRTIHFLQVQNKELNSLVEKQQHELVQMDFASHYANGTISELSKRVAALKKMLEKGLQGNPVFSKSEGPVKVVEEKATLTDADVIEFNEDSDSELDDTDAVVAPLQPSSPSRRGLFASAAVSSSDDLAGERNQRSLSR